MTTGQPLYKTTFQTPFNVIKNTELSQKIMKINPSDIPNIENLMAKLTHLDQNFTNHKSRILNNLEKLTNKLATVEKTVSEVVQFLAYKTEKVETNQEYQPCNNSVDGNIKFEKEDIAIVNDISQNFHQQFQNGVANIHNTSAKQDIQYFNNNVQTFEWLDEFQRKYPKQQQVQNIKQEENPSLNVSSHSYQTVFVDQNQNEVKMEPMENNVKVENIILKEEPYDPVSMQNCFIKTEDDSSDVKPDIKWIPDGANGMKTGLKPHSCNQCNYTASQAGNLRRHISIVHQKIKAFVCNDCNYSASMKHHLKKHFETVHHS